MSLYPAMRAPTDIRDIDAMTFPVAILFRKRYSVTMAVEDESRLRVLYIGTFRPAASGALRVLHLPVKRRNPRRGGSKMDRTMQRVSLEKHHARANG